MTPVKGDIIYQSAKCEVKHNPMLVLLNSDIHMMNIDCIKIYMYRKEHFLLTICDVVFKRKMY